MKARAAARLLGLVVGVFLCVVAAGKGAKSDAPPSAPVMTGAGAGPAAKPVELPKGVGEDWWSKVQESIRKDEYSVTWDEHPRLPGLKAAWQAPNRAQGFESYFTEKGVRVSRHVEDSPSWEWGLELARWGREGAMRDAVPAKPVVSTNRVDLDRGAIKEWYLNDERGLEQGFLIPAAPGPSSLIPNSEFRTPNSPLSLDLALTGTLRPVISEDGQAVDFYLPDGNVAVLRYAALKVTDATGRLLPSHFEGFCFSKSEIRNPKSEISSGGLRMIVDDTAATYPITVDPLATSPAWTATGENGSDEFGYSVATAGDVNGDGYSDVIVGAYYGNNRTGKAYLFLGSASGLSVTPSWTAVGEATAEGFGCSVATAGDVNGDGFSDVVIGASEYGSARGKAYVYLGGPSGLSATPSWTAVGEAGNDQFGYSVAAAGDVNGDGYSDVIVAAPYYSGGSNGKAYVYLGGPSGLSATASWTAVGEAASDRFGYSVATAGDVNGDGYSDVIVGAPFNGTLTGKAYVYLGGASGLSTTASWTAVGEATTNRFGYSVATAGDVNGDGYSDVIVGAPWNSSYTGKAYVYLGGPSGLSSTSSWTKPGENAGDAFGWSVETAGDVNGDGYSDVIVGAYVNSSGTGKAYLYLGGPSGLSSTSSWTRPGENAGDYFGWSVATAGDVNGDGYSDVIVGAYGNSSSTGKAYLYLGGPSGLSATSSWGKAGENAGDNFGYSVAAAGDVNGDGYSDVVVGAPFNSTFTGKAYLFLGGPSGLSTTASWTAAGEATYDYFGSSVATAGDVNGDGYSDVIIGAYGNTSGTGKAYVYLGGPSGLSTTASWTATGAAGSNAFGTSVATAGDVNGDGYSDVIVGAYGDTNYTGKAYLFLGGPSGLSTTASWTAAGEATNNYFGSSVATAGDVNGDGYSDVIIGAYGNTNGTGKAYVYLGGPSGLSATSSWGKAGENAGDNFGYSVAAAGDINRDGYSDVIVGAPYCLGGTGEVYAYLGGPSGLSTTASWTATGAAASNAFGNSVATAGDVNRDGYSDVIVGAPYFLGGTGKVYVYLGGPSGLSTTASWTATGEATGNFFGYSVATAGDVNGDGYSDVIVGAYGNSSSTGKAYMYYGGGGPDVVLKPQQLRADGSAPIAPLGSTADGYFNLSMQARSFFGRAKVKLEWQTSPLGGTFSSYTNPFQASPSWSDSGTAGVTLSRLQLLQASVWPWFLPSDDVPYIWRMRTKYSFVTTPFQGHGPWMTLAANGLMETDLRRVPACVLPTGVCSITSVTESGTSCTLTWTDPNPPNQRTGWNIRRSSDASLTKSSWPIMGLNVQSDPWTDSTGDNPASGVWFYEVTTYDANCPAEGPF